MNGAGTLVRVWGEGDRSSRRLGKGWGLKGAARTPVGHKDLWGCSGSPRKSKGAKPLERWSCCFPGEQTAVRHGRPLSRGTERDSRAKTVEKSSVLALFPWCEGGRTQLREEVWTEVQQCRGV